MLFCFLSAATPVALAQTAGKLQANLPTEVEKGKPFQLEVWLQPSSPDFNGDVKVSMDRTAKVKYDPQEFVLKPGDHRTVTATVLISNSGLAVIAAFADNWERIDVAINTGFTAKLKTNLSEPVESRTVKGLVLSFVDKDGKPLKWDATTQLYLRGTKILLHALNPDKHIDEWRDDVTMPLQFNTANAMPVEMKSSTWTADTGILSVQIATQQGYVIYDDTIYVSILPPWYSPLLMAMVGGIAYSMGQFSRNQFASRRRTGKSMWLRAAVSAITGLMAGLVAYLLAAWNVLGIKIDTTSLKGFVILGFLFSYVGVDVILKATTAKKT